MNNMFTLAAAAFFQVITCFSQVSVAVIGGSSGWGSGDVAVIGGSSGWGSGDVAVIGGSSGWGSGDVAVI
ncbi:MAG: hypothetical protein ACRYFK_11735, partial [Janthinobacterium lividum]